MGMSLCSGGGRGCALGFTGVSWTLPMERLSCSAQLRISSRRRATSSLCLLNALGNCTAQRHGKALAFCHEPWNKPLHNPTSISSELKRSQSNACSLLKCSKHKEALERVSPGVERSA